MNHPSRLSLARPSLARPSLARLSLAPLALAPLVWCAAARAQTVTLTSSVGHVVETSVAPATASVASGYGFTESVLDDDDSHHRLTAAIAASARLLPWLRAGLRVDGRYDSHTGATSGDDDGWVGDPRLFLEIDRPLGRARVGARAGVWLPGGDAPSIVGGATSFELSGTLRWDASERVALAAHVGYRIDRSAASAPNGMLAPGDRLALGVSDFDALLVGLGVAARAGRATILAQASADLLVGDGAPAAIESPLRLAVGVRVPIARAVDLEAMATVAPGARPAVDAAAPFVPVEPRVSIAIGATMTFGDAGAPPPPRRRELVLPVAPPLRDDVVVDRAPADLPPGQIRGVIRSFSGKPLRARVTIEPLGQVVDSSPDDGTFQIDVPPGEYEVVVEGKGYEKQRRKIRVVENGVTLINVDLRGKR